MFRPDEFWGCTGNDEVIQVEIMQTFDEILRDINTKMTTIVSILRFRVNSNSTTKINYND